MGVPKFFQWIAEKYPLIVKEYMKGEETPPDIDNLYVDMNGIIHRVYQKYINKYIPSFVVQEQWDKIFFEVFQFIEGLVASFKPHQVIYLALDGVAPKAKVNQQRERRYNSQNEVQKFLDVLKSHDVQYENQFSLYNSLMISPGTDFMKEFDSQCQYFIQLKKQTDQTWQNKIVIFSGSQTPGEGEHKIMEYIRNLKCSKELKHGLFGSDADLIILSLALDIRNIIIIRDDTQIVFNNERAQMIMHFKIIFINILLQYLEAFFQELSEKQTYNFKRIISDIVLIFTLLGNDFIPRLTTIDIEDDIIDVLLEIYKFIFPQFYFSTGEAYLMKDGVIQWDNFMVYIEKLKEVEQITINQRICYLQKEAQRNVRYNQYKLKSTQEQEKNAQVQNQEPKEQIQNQTQQVEKQQIQTEIIEDPEFNEQEDKKEENKQVEPQTQIIQEEEKKEEKEKEKQKEKGHYRGRGRGRGRGN